MKRKGLNTTLKNKKLVNDEIGDKIISTIEEEFTHQNKTETDKSSAANLINTEEDKPKQMTVIIPESLHTKLKIISAQRKIKIRDIIIELIEKL
ncbi:MAG: hypothetical protein L6Q54_12800 [Leptospiraceae bacterium]|nr:hypothetical protein [Leptospiraceae bacterium]